MVDRRKQSETDLHRRAEEARLFDAYAKTHDSAIRDELVERLMPFAKRLASRYSGGREALEDLEQVASLGLVKAIERFEPERGFSFATFAFPTILGELRRHFRDHSWSLHVRRDVRERSARVKKAVSELPTILSRQPTVNEIAERASLAPEDVLEILDAEDKSYPLSIDAPVAEGDGDYSPLVDSIGKEEHGYEAAENRAAIAPAIAELTERERLVLHLRFVEDRTQSEIGDRIGVSQMHVSRILRSIVQRLRDGVGDAHATDEVERA